MGGGLGINESELVPLICSSCMEEVTRDSPGDGMGCIRSILLLTCRTDKKPPIEHVLQVSDSSVS